MHRQQSIHMVKLWHLDKGDAIIHRYNASFRVLDGDNKERFYSQLNNAVKDLISEGYILTMGSFYVNLI
jgi:hypothetical protein